MSSLLQATGSISIDLCRVRAHTRKKLVAFPAKRRGKAEAFSMAGSFTGMEESMGGQPVYIHGRAAVRPPV
jgi:hypothetical protein